MILQKSLNSRMRSSVCLPTHAQTCRTPHHPKQQQCSALVIRSNTSSFCVYSAYLNPHIYASNVTLVSLHRRCRRCLRAHVPGPLLGSAVARACLDGHILVIERILRICFVCGHQMNCVVCRRDTSLACSSDLHQNTCELIHAESILRVLKPSGVCALQLPKSANGSKTLMFAVIPYIK